MSQAGQEPPDEGTYRIGSVGWLNALALEEEADRVQSLALTLTEGTHKLLELRGPLDLEEDLVVVVGHLDVEVLGLGWGLWALPRGRAVLLLVGRHCEKVR